MKLQFTNPLWLLLLAPAMAWIAWFAYRSGVSLSPLRRRIGSALRILIVVCVLLAIAGLQLLKPIEGMNVFFALDRSESIPFEQREAAQSYVNRVAKLKETPDKGGVVVFGSQAAIESAPNSVLDLQKVQAVVDPTRTDLAAAIQLATAAFPENGQKRAVLITDGNQNMGDALNAVMTARPLGVTFDVLPIGAAKGGDVFLSKVQAPSRVKQGQAFDVKIFLESDSARPATARLFRNDQLLGEQTVELAPGKNLFSFPQKLSDTGFYNYDIRVEAPGDAVPQNNRATAFTTVLGEPRVLVVSSNPAEDQPLVNVLNSSGLRPTALGSDRFPATLAELQSYDSIFLCNVAAGDLATEQQILLETAVRDFGSGLVVIGGDQSFTAGGYKGTALERTLPVTMELDSKKVVPSGAVVLVMHGMEFNNGNEVARACAQGVLDALAPRDELGVVLWDGSERWLFPLTTVGDKKAARRQIAGMQQGDLGSFQNILQMANDALVKSTSNLKHIIVFSDGDPAAPSPELMSEIVKNRITVSTVLIAGHFGPQTMIFMAEAGKGRFHNVVSPADLPQIFLKETAVILKSAIYEQEFAPRVRSNTELIRGIDGYPKLLGYVATMPKDRAEVPLITDQSDPLLAHWQYGLGRSVAFTSDARSRWAKNWLGWQQYRQFWSQVAQWSLRRIESANLHAETSIENGEGRIQVEALTQDGEYRNFLNLQAIVSSPSGERETVPVRQTGPGYYEARFATRETGSYLVNLTEVEQGKVRASQVLGASVNFSPEFASTGVNFNLLRQLADNGGGKVLSMSSTTEHPFAHDRRKTYQPQELWQLLLEIAAVLFVFDVAMRRLQIDREEWARAWVRVRSLLPGYKPAPTAGQESVASLLQRRKSARAASGEAGALPTWTASGKQEPEVSVIHLSLPPENGDQVAANSGAGNVDKDPTKPDKGDPQQDSTGESTTSKLLAARRRAQKK